tara:strand:+ start:333 stop:638 length:306 start_codon:yes stop_codon:yes gene_type:complete
MKKEKNKLMTKEKQIHKAKELLISEGYYIMNNEPYCFWSVLDVEVMLEQFHEDEKFTDISYTEDLGEAVMDLIERRFDANHGVTWDTLRNAIEEIIEEENE